MKAYVIDAVRTPRGRGKAGKGALSGVHPQELLATVLRALAGRTASMQARRGGRLAGCVCRPASKGRTSRATRCSRPGGPSRSARP